MRKLQLLCGLLTAGSAVFGASSIPDASKDVYQYTTFQGFLPEKVPVPEGVNVRWLFELPHESNLYLWIPPKTETVRGIILLADNVPEQWLGGHAKIRKVATDNHLAILYGNQSFRLFGVNHTDKRVIPQDKKDAYAVKFMQQILNALAEKSGYPELRTVPWLPMGESMSLQLVNNYIGGAPERMIAGVWIKDAPFFVAKESVPMLGAVGTGDEWGFHRSDVFKSWKDKAVRDTKSYDDQRKKMPLWPGSLLVEAGSAHFSCSEAMIDYIAKYIDAAVKARLSGSGGGKLKPVDLTTGYVTRLPGPGVTNPMPPKSYRDAQGQEKLLPWFFTKELAEDAYKMADVNWNAKTQVATVFDKQGKRIPYHHKSGLVEFTPELDADGISFSMDARWLDRLPEDCKGAGTPLTHVADAPRVEWMYGPVKPLGTQKFQIAIDRSGVRAERKTGISKSRDVRASLRVIHEGDKEYRFFTNPISMKFPVNKVGKDNRISFSPIPNQKAGVKELTLNAEAASGLPVGYYVKSGPAYVEGNKLIFTEIPVKSKYPVEVIVGAWQWGRNTDPKVKTADVVEKTFYIEK